MAALSPILRSVAGGKVAFFCPGCREAHAIGVTNETGARWTWEGGAEQPTFSPSILVEWTQWEPPVTGENLAEWRRAPWQQARVEKRCHSHVVAGQIQFLADCTHALASQTAPLPPFDDTEVA